MYLNNTATYVSINHLNVEKYYTFDETSKKELKNAVKPMYDKLSDESKDLVYKIEKTQ